MNVVSGEQQCKAGPGLYQCTVTQYSILRTTYAFSLLYYSILLDIFEKACPRPGPTFYCQHKLFGLVVEIIRACQSTLQQLLNLEARLLLYESLNHSDNEVNSFTLDYRPPFSDCRKTRARTHSTIVVDVTRYQPLPPLLFLVGAGIEDGEGEGGRHDSKSGGC